MKREHCQRHVNPSTLYYGCDWKQWLNKHVTEER